MFEHTRLFGISMAPRANRRRLVVITYGATLGLAMAALLLVGTLLSSRIGQVLAVTVLGTWWVLVVIVGRGIFGRFAPSDFRMWAWIGPPPRAVQADLGLAASPTDDEPRFDEREIALHDHAYYLAYKGLVIGLLYAVFPAVGLGVMVSRRVGMLAVMASIYLFLVVALTLPQALILWMERDLDGR